MNKLQSLLKKYLSSNDNKEVLQHSLLLFFMKIFFAFISFVLSIVIARNLSVDDSGVYFSIISLVAVLSTVSRVGLDNTVTRFIAQANTEKNESKVSQVFSTAVKWSTIGSLLVALIFAMFGGGYIYYSQQVESYLEVLFLIIIILPITSVNQILQQSFQGLKKTALFALFSGVARLITLFLLLIVLFFINIVTLNIALYIFASATFIAFSLAMLMWNKQRDHAIINHCEDKQLHQRMKKSCLSLWGVSCFAIIMADGVQVMIGLFSEAEQASYFAISMRVASLVAFILVAINGILSPKFAEISTSNDPLRLQSVYRAATRLMLIITTPILLGIFIFADNVLLVFGEQFQQATAVLRILVIAQFFKVAVGSVGQLLIMTGNERCQRNNLFFSVIVLLVLCLLLIPFYGALGGAIATLCAIATNNLLGLLQVKIKLNITLF